MNQIGNWIRGLAATLGGLIGWLFGELDGFFYALITFVVLDYITGVITAAVEKKLNSEVGFKGIARKVAIFVLVALAHVIDRQAFNDAAVLRTAVIFFYLSNEGLSILENVARIGLPVPAKFKEVLEQLQHKGDKDETL